MKTTLHVLTILYGALKTSSLATTITGAIRKGERPAGSTKEDIVLSTLPIGNDPLQHCYANVHIVVPNLSVKENGLQTSVPDFARLDTLTTMAVAVLRDIRQPQEYHISVNQVSDVTNDRQSNSSFITVRVDFYSYNIN